MVFTPFLIYEDTLAVDTPMAKATSYVSYSGILKCFNVFSPFLFQTSLELRGVSSPHPVVL